MKKNIMLHMMIFITMSSWASDGQAPGQRYCAPSPLNPLNMSFAELSVLTTDLQTPKTPSRRNSSSLGRTPEERQQRQDEEKALAGIRRRLFNH